MRAQQNYRPPLAIALCASILLAATGMASAQGPAATANPKGNPGLFEAIRSGNSDALRSALSGGADVNDTLANGYSALMSAALNGTAEQMKILLEHGAWVNYANGRGISALWLSVPDWEKTSLLLDRGADPRLRSAEKYTVLVKLVGIPGTGKLIQLLIDHGADPQKSSPDNMILYNAASSCDTSVVGLLLRYGVNPNDTTYFGDYPINAALNYRCFPTVKMLIDHGAKVNVRPMSFQLDPLNGITPLMFAAGSGDRASFNYILEHGADPNLKSKNGYTALMYLQQAEKDEPEMTLALLDHGAEAATKRSDGDDALSMALKKGNCRSAQIIKKYLTDKSCSPCDTK